VIHGRGKNTYYCDRYLQYQCDRTTRLDNWDDGIIVTLVSKNFCEKVMKEAFLGQETSGLEEDSL
jgi:hypothetical protein